MNKIISLLFLLVFFIGCKDETPPTTMASNPTNNISKKIINNLTYNTSNIVLPYQIEIFQPYYPMYYGSLATNFSITPALPTGLYFSSLSGRIAGTPEELQIIPKKYTITASNEYGSTSTDIYIQITHQSPFGLRYNLNELNLLTNISEVSFFPDVSPGYRGGALPTSYTITPQLPTGLVFDESTGAIEGIATTSFPLQNFIITAINSGGSTSTTLTISSKSQINDIQLGVESSCAIINKDIMCWGDNQFNQVSSIMQPAFNTPTMLNYSFGDIRSLISGTDINCVIQMDSKILCWGNNKNSFLGNGFNEILNTPTLIDDLVIFGSLSRFTHSSDDFHGCYITNSGFGFCAGYFGPLTLAGQQYQIRNIQNIPISGINNIQSGNNFVCFLANNQTYCLGNNEYGQLGNNSQLPSALAVSPIGLETGVVNISTGSNFACALKNNKIYCWGDNEYGQLGSNSISLSQVPIEVLGIPTDKIISKIMTGKNHACALADSELYCWGSNQYGQIAQGSIITPFFTTPQKIKKNSTTDFSEPISSFSAGANHNCIISNNEVFCWGANNKGQLGTNDYNSSFYPVKISF